MSQLTKEIASALSKMQQMQIESDTDLKEFQKVSDLLEEMQTEKLRLNDWRALAELQKYMQEKDIKSIEFGTDYNSDDQGGSTEYLTVNVSFLASADKKDDEDYQYEIQEEIESIFDHRSPSFLDGKSVRSNRFDAFVKKLMGEKEFAQREKWILDRTAKVATSVKKPARV